MNRCYIISREQITKQLKIQLANSTEQAKRICSLNKQHYIDSVYLTLDDLKQLSDMIDDESAVQI